MTVAGGPIHETVLAGASALNATHDAIPAPHYTNLRVLAVGSVGVSAGAVQLEGALTKTFAGTWIAIGAPVTVTDSVVTSSVAVNCGFPYVRARVSTAVADGTATVVIVGN